MNKINSGSNNNTCAQLQNHFQKNRYNQQHECKQQVRHEQGKPWQRQQHLYTHTLTESFSKQFRHTELHINEISRNSMYEHLEKMYFRFQNLRALPQKSLCHNIPIVTTLIRSWIGTCGFNINSYFSFECRMFEEIWLQFEAVVRDNESLIIVHLQRTHIHVSMYTAAKKSHKTNLCANFLRTNYGYTSILCRRDIWIKLGSTTEQIRFEICLKSDFEIWFFHCRKPGPDNEPEARTLKGRGPSLKFFQSFVVFSFKLS